MKILILGDIHGRSKWRQFINNLSEYDKVVLMMDMFDSYDISPNDQITNAKELIKFISENDKVIALSSNHDWSYLDPLLYKCPGFNAEIAPEATKLMQDIEHLFTHAVELDGFLFSHAGVSSVWLNRYNRGDEHLPIDEQVNNVVRRFPGSLNFAQNQGRYFSGSGNDITQSPIWIRPESLIKVMAHPKQVVGHTQVKKPEVMNVDDTSLYLTDSPDYYTVMDNGEFKYYKYDNL